MKVIMFLLSFMFVSCVTANTNSRDLSGVNPSPELISANNQFESCLSDCKKDGGILLFCSDSCLKLSKSKKPALKVADYATCKHACERDCCSYHPAPCPRACSDECNRICR